jgi:hypothetical protein
VGDPSLRTKLEEFKESFEQAAAAGLAEAEAARAQL